MNINMNGNVIDRVHWPDTESEQGRQLQSGEKLLLVLSATEYPDHAEFWILELHKVDGEWHEVARHNPRYVETIVWEI